MAGDLHLRGKTTCRIHPEEVTTVSYKSVVGRSPEVRRFISLQAKNIIFYRPVCRLIQPTVFIEHLSIYSELNGLWMSEFRTHLEGVRVSIPFPRPTTAKTFDADWLGEMGPPTA